MAKTIPTQIRIDSDTKKLSSELFARLGLDMSTAVNMFLSQCVLRNGLPFTVSMPEYNQETLEAMVEAKRIAHDPDVKGYTNMHDLMSALDA
ncbi:type II toxin-antitoxin system RelB/DinJ family antitoxin [Ligilactobacillus ceti]|nr:type II toxin-antitoxin system RelB/DinJ family antitoxin [Ligilactobacillus ceti]